jgi:hypothetical protein
MNVNARREHDPPGWVSPAGYACQFGGWSGTVNLIACNRTAGPLATGNAVGCDLKAGPVYRVWFQRDGDLLSLHIDGREVYRLRDPVPLVGEGLDWAAFRSWGEAELLSLAVWRKGAPQKASAVIAGDVCVRRGDLAGGVSEYRRVAQDQPGTSLAQEALLRAYLTASLMPGTDTVRANIRAELARRYPRSKVWPRVLESWCLELWRAGKADSALTIAESILHRSPDSAPGASGRTHAQRQPAAARQPWYARPRAAARQEAHEPGLPEERDHRPLAACRHAAASAGGNREPRAFP